MYINRVPVRSSQVRGLNLFLAYETHVAYNYRKAHVLELQDYEERGIQKGPVKPRARHEEV